MNRFVITTAALLIFAPTAFAGGDAAAGKAKAAVCAGCHGADGNSVNPMWPKLAGQHATYLVKTIKDYKLGKRKDPMMGPMSAPLSDADINNLAAYFSSQKQK